MRSFRLSATFFLSLVAACGTAPESVPEPAVLEAHDEFVRRESIPYFAAVPSANSIARFSGCYDVDLGDEFPRPHRWPSRISLRLSSTPSGDLYHSLLASSPLPASLPPVWFAHPFWALVDWNEGHNSIFQLVLESKAEGLVAKSPLKAYPVPARSIRRVPCPGPT